jgi:putative oxidoreductase
MVKRMLETPDDPILTIHQSAVGSSLFSAWCGAQKLLGWFGGGGSTAIASAASRVRQPRLLMAVLLIHIHVGFFMNCSGRQKGEGFEFHLLVFAIAIPLIIRRAGALSVDHLIARQITLQR